MVSAQPSRVRDIPREATLGLPSWQGWGVRPPDLVNAGRDAYPVVGYMSWLVQPEHFPGHQALWPLGMLSLWAMMKKNIVGTQVRRHAPIVSQARDEPY